ncbi:MAG: CMP-N-acetylneuraminic acid synthetase [Bacillota bacterium]|nr:CMP-N-acetylneuraminic acid synthetase [Bacillota bacterium]
MKLLITICGRAGSKGVKNKNIKPFIGKPLVLYTISAALLYREAHANDHIDICVSSDSDELLQLADRFELDGIHRPEDLSRDTASKVSVIRHAANQMENERNLRYDLILDLDITSPLRTLEDMENAIEKILHDADADESTDADVNAEAGFITDVVFSVVPARRNPYFNMVEIRDGKARRIFEQSYISRQQAPQVYDMNASIYCYRRDSLMNHLKDSPLDGTFDVILMRDTAVLDIDSEEDFELMEFLADRIFYHDFREILDYADRLMRQAI